MKISLFFSALTIGSHAAPQNPRCKNTHLSPGWPSNGIWSQLNTTLSGNLMIAHPPAIVCDPNQGYFDKAKCKAVGDHWFNADLHYKDPVSVFQPNWQQDACLPTAIYNQSTRCNIDIFPKYVVNASKIEYIVDAVKFANQHNLRVSIKNTGHDYLGRSTSPELSLWTHYLRGIQFTKDFRAKRCHHVGNVPAMTIGAGTQFSDVYEAAKAYDVIVVGGDSASVGIGGYITGGGHSPVGSMYGLAVDNVLEMQLVTPTGEFITANECQNSDLFWAMKGGGGSTFGVLTSVTVIAHPNYKAANFTMYYQSSAAGVKDNEDGFFNLLADMHAEIVKWSDNYINGYIELGPEATIAGKNSGFSTPENGSAVLFQGWGLNMTVKHLNKLMDPFVQKINSTNTFGVFKTQQLRKTTDIFPVGAGNAPSGSNLALTSRILSKESLITNRKRLIEVLRAVGVEFVQGVVVSGPGMRDHSKAKYTSVTDAWRRSYMHIFTGVHWPYHNASAKAVQLDILTNKLGKALRSLAPNSGCYLNEADVNEPNRTYAFWGNNYPRLLAIKRRVDPNSIFWCKPCVGSEDWKLDSDTGALCRV